MRFETLESVSPSDERLIARLADLGGTSFLEEPFTQMLLDGMGLSAKRRAEVSRAIIDADVRKGAKHHAVFCTPDASALAVAYLQSELEMRWEDVENAANEHVVRNALSPREATAFERRMSQMALVANFSWHASWIAEHMPGSDFIHFPLLAVAPEARGSGAFRRLVTPFLDLADERGLPVFLETYSDRLELLYRHFGFEVASEHRADDLPSYERCMARLPR